MDLRVIFHKQVSGEDLWGIVGMFEHRGAYYLTRQDQRETDPVIHLYADFASASRVFNDTVDICKERGWSVVYCGRPYYSG